MKYVTAYGNGDRRSRLIIEDGATRQSIAEECREAALSFMSGVAQGWDKLDLVLWLTGPYSRATRHGRHGERVAVVHESDPISEGSLESLVTRVRGQLIASLERGALELGALDFAEEMVERGIVRRVVDADEREAWVPLDGTRLRLRDRVQSLFTADYLNAPYAYTELFVCHRCEAVVFDTHAKRVGLCGTHRLSGMVQREGEPAVPASVQRRAASDE